jgi:hypothetical protein
MVDTFKHSPVIMQNVRGTWYEQFFLHYIFFIHILCLSGLKFCQKNSRKLLSYFWSVVTNFSGENAASIFTLKIEVAAFPQT